LKHEKFIKCATKSAVHTGRSGFSSSFGFNKVAAAVFFSRSFDVGLYSLVPGLSANSSPGTRQTIVNSTKNNLTELQ